MMVVLPAMLLLAGKKNLFPSSMPRITAMPLLERFFKYPKGVLVFLLVLTLLASLGFSRCASITICWNFRPEGWNPWNMKGFWLKPPMNPPGMPSFPQKPWNRSKNLTKKFMAIPSVARVESVLDFIPTRQEEKSAQYRKAAKALQNVPDAIAAGASRERQRLKEALLRLSNSLENLEEKLFAAGATTGTGAVGKVLDTLDSAMGNWSGTGSGRPS
jgi:hypothetical protein